MKWQLPNSVVSPQDFQSAILEIKQYAKWLAHASVKKQVAGGAVAQPAPMSPGALHIMRDGAGDKQLNQASLDELIKALEEFEKSAPRMTITLGAPPSNGLKKDIVDWCRQNVDPHVLVSFEFNSTLLGGMVVRWGSHIYDWSFRRQLLAARERFPEVLRHV